MSYIKVEKLIASGKFAQAAERAFKKAAAAAVAENDRLGITTHGAVNGKLVERKPQPPKAARAAKA
jgi:hypothetical protein